MTSNARRRHLVTGNPHRPNVRVACGKVNPPRRTTVPSEVTCDGCKRTVQMADAEVKWNATRGKGAW